MEKDMMRIHAANLGGNILIFGTILWFSLFYVLLASFGCFILSQSCISHNNGTIYRTFCFVYVILVALLEQICPYRALAHIALPEQVCCN